MSFGYEYSEQKPYVFTDQGSRDVIRVFRFADGCFKFSGAATAGVLMNKAETSSSWEKMACVDRLVEMGEIREIPQAGCFWQHRVFVSGRL